MNKKVLANLEKCYSIAPLHYKNADHILVAAEKTDRCILFDIDGNAEGEMILQLPEVKETAERMIKDLKAKNLGVEVLDHYVG